MRNVLEEFLKSTSGQREPTILGLREHVFTGRSAQQHPFYLDEFGKKCCLHNQQVYLYMLLSPVYVIQCVITCMVHIQPRD